MAERDYTSRRQEIVDALVTLLKTIDGTGEFLTDLSNNVWPRLKFWDEVNDFPAVHINAGNETRDYQGGGFADRYLFVTIRLYVEQENAVNALGKLIEDIETVIEENSAFYYNDKRGAKQRTYQTSILGITTDEGVLEPLGAGEIEIEIRH